MNSREHGARGRIRTAARMAVRRDRLLGLMEMSLSALVLVISLFAVVRIMGGELLPRHALLALLAFLWAFPGTERHYDSVPRLARIRSPNGSA